MNVEKIVLKNPEGYLDYTKQFPVEFSSFADATAFLTRNSFQFPDDGTYDKHNFDIFFEDGEVYSGRLDCKHHQQPDNDLDVKRHCVEFLEWHCNPDNAKKVGLCEETINMMKIYLETYFEIKH